MLKTTENIYEVYTCPSSAQVNGTAFCMVKNKQCYTLQDRVSARSTPSPRFIYSNHLLLLQAGGRQNYISDNTHEDSIRAGHN